MIRLFITDLDNTLLNQAKKIEEKDKQAISRLTDQNISICLASGRIDHDLIRVSEQLGKKVHRISQNGAFIYTVDDKCLLTARFEPLLAKQLYEFVQDYPIIPFISVEDYLLVPHVDELLEEIIPKMITPVQVDPHVLENIGKTVFPCKIIILGEYEHIKQLEKEIQANFNGQVESYISDINILDLMPPNISKGSAVLKLIDHLGLTPDEIATIGDSYNDIPMLKVTPHSFAMSHAFEDVKKEAAHTVDSVSQAVDWILEYNRRHSK